MTRTEKTRDNTNKAWNSLYCRLAQDGLLPKDDTPRTTTLASTTFRWVAGVAAVLIGVVLVSITINHSGLQNPLLSVYNEKDESTLVTTLEDGSIVYLSEQTSLQFPPHFGAEKREVYLQGNAFFDVKGNRKHPFVINTELIEVEVLGTAFNVKERDSDRFSLSVARGEVKITLKKTRQSIRIKAGETGLLRGDELQTVLTQDLNQFDRYTRQMQFKDERLADVIRVINKNTEGLEVELAPGLENRLLTVSFSNDSVLSMTQLICMALQLECIQNENKIRISESK